MRKFILAIISLLFINSIMNAQNVYFTLANTAKFLKRNNTDTLKYPFVGGFQKPQFNKMDLDNDGQKDLVVFDGIGDKVFTYLWKNNSWVYEPSYEKFLPNISQWLKITDFNCDGKDDLLTASGPAYVLNPGEYVKSNSIRYLQNISTTNNLKFKQRSNCLTYINSADFEDCLEFTPTDIGAIEDMDNDGDPDVVYMPSGSNYFDLYRNRRPKNNCDSINFGFGVNFWGHVGYKVNSHGFNFGLDAYYLGKGGKHVSNSFAVFDTDADGDKDLIYGDGFFNTLIFAKNGRESNSLLRDSFVTEDTIFPRNTYRPLDLSWPTPYFQDYDNDGITDLIITSNEPAAVKNTNHINLYKNTATSNNTAAKFQFVKENFLIDEMIDLGGNSKPVFVDIDNDDDQDLIIATQGNYLSTKNNFDQLYLYKNIGTKINPIFSLVDTNFANIQADVRLPLTNVIPTFGDLNNDGKKDMILGWYNGYLNYYENTSTTSNITFAKRDSNYFNINAGTQIVPQLIDLNADGKLDLVIGKYNGTLAYYQNTGTVTEPSFNSTPTIDSLGKLSVRSRSDSYGNAYPFVFDLDNDGIYEALIGSYSKSVVLYTDISANPAIKARRIANIFKDDANMAADSISQGVYTSVTIANIDADASPEVLIGNQRGGFKFYKSTILGKISLSTTHDLTEQTFEAKIYPNPAKNKLTVETDLLNEKAQVSIINILGATVINQAMARGTQTATIELTNLNAGVYFVKIQTETGKQLVKRLVIE